jgi:hypothetical protein
MLLLNFSFCGFRGKHRPVIFITGIFICICYKIRINFFRSLIEQQNILQTKNCFILCEKCCKFNLLPDYLTTK